jgi:hypothetical protein
MRFPILAATLIAAAPLAGAAATIDLFDDRAAFLLAAGPVMQEDFNGVAGEPSFRTAPLAVGGLTLLNTSLDDKGFIDEPPFMFEVYDIDGTNVANLQVTNETTVTIGFAAPATAFGASFSHLNNDELRAVFEIDDQTVTPPVQDGPTIQFVGLVSDEAFTSLTIRNVSGAVDGFSMDNVVYNATDASPISLPASAAMLAPALLGLALLARWRRS